MDPKRHTSTIGETHALFPERKVHYTDFRKVYYQYVL